MSSPAWLTIIVSIITACGGGIVAGPPNASTRAGHQSDIDRLAGEIAKLDVQLAKVCSNSTTTTAGSTASNSRP